MINDSWCNCNNIQDLQSICSPDVEFLTIKCRPYYLPRGFSSVIDTAVYIPPQTDSTTALKELELAIVFTDIFNTFLSQSAVPTCFKMATCSCTQEGKGN
ncbi:unnamed protein product [Oncorhynchus mykiss]|uniref:Uncharacterized protein n=1 Tax=Oncorhynchus mykiss TaxID=8022 RepID=A0A060Z5Y3_ONCMY|nr:unnamed protein product [Oncorhynchus mykiss]